MVIERTPENSLRKEGKLGNDQLICCETYFVLIVCKSKGKKFAFAFLWFHCGNFSLLNFAGLSKITNFDEITVE